MEYKTGSYIITAKKEHTCHICGLPIHSHVPYFARVREFGEVFTKKDGSTFRKKDYFRFHIECARQMTNLNDYEINLLNRPK